MEEDEEGLHRRGSHGIDAMVLEQHRALALAELLRDRVLEVVAVAEVILVPSDRPVEEEGGLGERQEAFLLGRDRHDRVWMSVDDRVHVGPPLEDGAPDRYAADVDHIRLRGRFGAVSMQKHTLEGCALAEPDLDQARCRRLLKEEAPLVHQHRIGLIMQPRHHALRSEVRAEAVEVHDASQGCKLDPIGPFTRGPLRVACGIS